jgi:hypothetical protein
VVTASVTCASVSRANSSGGGIAETGGAVGSTATFVMPPR